MAPYAVVTGNVVTNVVECADPVYAGKQGWVAITAAGPALGWTTANGGVTWTPPPPAVTVQNAATIEANLLAQLAQIETWITGNPAGAVLTAGQTLILAQMMAGITRTLLNLTQTVGGS